MSCSLLSYTHFRSGSRLFKGWISPTRFEVTIVMKNQWAVFSLTTPRALSIRWTHPVKLNQCLIKGQIEGRKKRKDERQTDTDNETMDQNVLLKEMTGKMRESLKKGKLISGEFQWKSFSSFSAFIDWPQFSWFFFSRGKWRKKSSQRRYVFSHSYLIFRGLTQYLKMAKKIVAYYY